MNTRIDYNELIVRIREIPDFFNNNDIPFDNDSPLGIAMNNFEELYVKWTSGITQVQNDKDFDDLLDGLRLSQIYNGLKWVCEQGSFEKEEIKRILLDDIDTIESFALDICFELDIADKFEKSGIVAIKAEPDVKIEYKGVEYSIACKRIRKKKTLLKNIRKAAKQIQKYDRKGIIAINITSLVSEDVYQNLYEADNEIIAKQKLSTFTNNIFNESDSKIWDIIKTEGELDILGVILYLQLPFYLFDQKLSVTAEWLSFCINPFLNKNNDKRNYKEMVTLINSLG